PGPAGAVGVERPPMGRPTNLTPIDKATRVPEPAPDEKAVNSAGYGRMGARGARARGRKRDTDVPVFPAGATTRANQRPDRLASVHPESGVEGCPSGEARDGGAETTSWALPFDSPPGERCGPRPQPLIESCQPDQGVR